MFAGLVAWASYLDEIRKVEAWMFALEGQTLVVTLVEALGNVSAGFTAGAAVSVPMVQA
jgi:hypothetical protein